MYIDLLNNISEKTALAGELGILLKLEKDLKMPLQALDAVNKGRLNDDLNSKEFNEAEADLQVTLSQFIKSGKSNNPYKSKLFSEDIAHSLAFVDLMKLRFDAIVMNPPFGKPSVNSESYMEINYPDNQNEIYQAFVDRGQELLVPGGFLGAITSRTGFFLGTFEKQVNRGCVISYDIICYLSCVISHNLLSLFFPG